MYHISLLSKAETQFLNGKRQVSKSYEYRLKSIIKKKLSCLIDQEIPLISQLFPALDLTKFSKVLDANNRAADLIKNSKNNSNDTDTDLTKNSKTTTNNKIVNLPTNLCNHINSTKLNRNKLYNCQQDTYQTKIRRVRSVVRISRRSSEPQVMGSKPTGPA
jgi:uncharacterized protein YjgD (DUF1641 family)